MAAASLLARLRVAGPAIASAVASASAVLALREYVADVTECAGPSMLPTLSESGDYVLSDKLSLRLWPSSLKSGDVVIARSPSDPKMRIVKRVVAMPGEEFFPTFRTPFGPQRSAQPVVLPAGSVWLQGDNASNSVDSRTYGPVRLEHVESRVVRRILPRSRAGAVVPRPDLAAEAGNRTVAAARPAAAVK